MRLRFATICSGVEAVSLAWEPLGFEPVFFSEIEPFPNALLAHRWPDVPNLGDLTRIDGLKWRGHVDILWSSAPCQDFSAGGQRRGADGARGALTLAQVDLVDAIDPPVFCFENVKGLLSDKSNAFGQFLGRLAGSDGVLVPPGKRWTHAGYVLGPRRAIAWRLVDAQHFGVAQQRERVYLVACPRGGRDPREILLNEGGVRRDVAPVRRAGANAPAALEGSAPRGLGFGGEAETARCLTAADTTARLDPNGETYALQPDAPEASAYTAALRTRDGMPVWELGKEGLSHCLRASQGGSDKAFALHRHGLSWRLRRLMPVECERLQGMPDDHTLVPFRGRPASDSVRYKAIGNSLAVPCVRWLGERIRDAALTS